MEVLVIMGIIGLLVGLTIPAVQKAREAARRAQCASNLRQMMVAVQGFDTAYNGFPSVHRIEYEPENRPVSKVFPLHCLLLPYMDQGDLYNNINFSLPNSGLEFVTQYHLTVASQRVAIFLCPSDPNVVLGPLAPVSYRACRGNGEILMDLRGGYTHPADGLFYAMYSPNDPMRPLPNSGVGDGLSQTLAFSEKPIGSALGSTFTPFRDDSVVRVGPGSVTADDWLAICSRSTPNKLGFNAGKSWMISGAIFTGFFGSAPPNSRVPDCSYDGQIGTRGVFAARSYHPGGVNAAMGDGAVRWFSSGTDRRLWRSLATRNGGEIAPSDGF